MSSGVPEQSGKGRVLPAILRLCRVSHWIKNLLVLLPLFYAERLFAAESPIGAAALAFLSFSFVASAVYVFNDIRDAARDRLHPVRRDRPIACGDISTGTAFVLGGCLLLAGFACGLGARCRGTALILLGAYFAMNVAYSVVLKDIVLADVFVLAAGYLLRIFYGGACFGIPISSWLFLCVFATALFIAFGKRRCELAHGGADGRTRPVLAKYSAGFLRVHYYACCVLSIAFYALWTVLRTGGSGAGKLALTIPLFVFIIFRYNMIIESGKSDGDPVPLLLHDGWLLAFAAAFALLNAVLLYAGKV